MNVDSKKLWDVEDVCRETGLAGPTVRQMANKGELPGFKIGRQFRFEEGDLARHLLMLKAKAGIAVS
jgi:excisionase family DNA binding protein